jgi:hypothetical protein
MIEFKVYMLWGIGEDSKLEATFKLSGTPPILFCGACSDAIIVGLGPLTQHSVLNWLIYHTNQIYLNLPTRTRMCGKW